MKQVEDLPDSGALYVHLGCLARGKYPSIEYSTLKNLRTLGFKPSTSSREVCCGGLLYLFGFSSFKSMTSFIGWNTWTAAEHSKIIASVCDTCYSAYLHVLKEIRENPDVKGEVEKALGKVGVKPVWDMKVYQVAEIYYRVKDRLLELQKKSLEGMKIAVHHGCHYAKAFPDEVLGKPENIRFLKELVESLGGEAVEYAEENLCCGTCLSISGYCDRKASVKTTEAKISSMREAGAELIVVTCPGCLVTFDEAPKELNPLPVLHVSELVGLALGLDPARELVLHDRRTKVRLPPLKVAAREG
ncbi:MAG: heterodisulfide reductase-related iron-sulfur binding cluster [Candidatus Hecatellaceae archaeon]